MEPIKNELRQVQSLGDVAAFSRVPWRHPWGCPRDLGGRASSALCCHPRVGGKAAELSEGWAGAGDEELSEWEATSAHRPFPPSRTLS